MFNSHKNLVRLIMYSSRFLPKGLPLKTIIMWISLFIFLSAIESLGDLSSSYEEVIPSMIEIYIYDAHEDKAYLSGSGFLINEDGEAITCFHVINNTQNIFVKTFEGQVEQLRRIRHDKDSDLAIFSTNISQPLVQPLRLSSDLPRAGEDIYVVGCPSGFNQTMSPGYVSAIRKDEIWGTVLQIDAKVLEASSGSPIFNRNGEVVGIIKYTSGTFGFAIPAEKVLKLMLAPNKTLSEWRLTDAGEFYISGLDLLTKNNLYALYCFREARIRDPNHAGAWYMEGVANLKLKEYPAALLCFNRSLDLNSSQAAVWNDKGIALSEMGDLEEALWCYNRSLKLDHQLAVALNNKGIALQEKGRYEEAIKCYEDAISLNQSYSAAWNNKAACRM